MFKISNGNILFPIKKFVLSELILCLIYRIDKEITNKAKLLSCTRAKMHMFSKPRCLMALYHPANNLLISLLSESVNGNH